MAEQFDSVEIKITDFIEDPVDGSAFGVNFQVSGPGTKVDYLRLSFSDFFIEEYFQIMYPKDLAKEEKRLLTKKRDLFVKWAVYRIEMWLEAGRPEQNIIVDGSKDIEWAKKIEKDSISPTSLSKSKRTYAYALKRKSPP